MEEILQELIGSLYHFKGFYTSQVVSLPDFWTINSIPVYGKPKWTQMNTKEKVQWPPIKLINLGHFENLQVFFGICFKDESCFGFTSKR